MTGRRCASTSTAPRSRASPATGSILTSTNPLQIGSDSIYGQYFNGLIDEVRIYNTALTAAQIQTDMATAIGGGAPPPIRRRRRSRALSLRRRPGRRVNLSLDGLDRQRAGSPATRSSAARAPAAPTYAADGDDRQRPATPVLPPPPATATASARRTPPRTSAATRTPPARPPPRPTRRRRRSRAR